MEFLEPPLVSEMKCYSCIFSKALTPYEMECRNNPTFVVRQADDWCGRGVWRIWSKRFKAWCHYYYNEGRDDTDTQS